MKYAPFEEMHNGQPVWRLQVEDPAAAAKSDLDFSCRQVSLPSGKVFALALALHDGQGRPLVFHHALITQSPGFNNLKATGSALVLFERHGFISGGEQRFPVDLSSLDPNFTGTTQALVEYVEAWRRELPIRKNPREIWLAMERVEAAAGPKKGMPWWLPWFIAIDLAATAWVVWKFLLKH